MEFSEPLDGCFTHMAWDIDLTTRGPFVTDSRKRKEFGHQLMRLAEELRGEGVRSVHTLETTVVVPVKGGPRYDLALLLHDQEPMRALLEERTLELGFPAPIYSGTAHNSGRFGDTEGQEGEILLNHFTGEASADDAVQTWKSVSSWYARVLGVDNSTLLEFSPGSPFLIMNYAVLPGRAVPFLAGQVLRPSFYRVVRRELHDAGIQAFPLIARRLR